MSHPCAKILEYSDSMVGWAWFIFETLIDWISKTRHPCAFLQSLSENIDHSLEKKFSGGAERKWKLLGDAKSREPFRPIRIISFGINLFPWVWIVKLLYYRSEFWWHRFHWVWCWYLLGNYMYSVWVWDRWVWCWNLVSVFPWVWLVNFSYVWNFGGR